MYWCGALELVDESGNDLKDQLPKRASLDDYEEIFRILQNRYNISYLAMTHQETISVHRNWLSAMLSEGERYYQSSSIDVEIVGRVGAGDAFSAGIISSLINRYNLQGAIRGCNGMFWFKAYY